ncbi:gustatory receptor for sugar taste 64b-like [Toxorhynchites rutilus septentrionalis]|uniref:gustatory receptor for sugar taste 64b-like n=1 Tax=Toxorhynchites rutilus septentrionalis TaxID=329112 RepID=UPI00247984D2|nr:gustatory receptor for sugar taste 64b-like [Toxorhynchites rutilus septentrionalis]
MKPLGPTYQDSRKNIQSFKLPWANFHRLKLIPSDGSFHQAVAPVLFLGQCITLIPVVGIFNATSRNTHFKLRSVRCVYSILYLTIGGVYCLLDARRCILKGLNVTSFGDLVYTVVVYTAAVFFLFVALQWQSILKEFENCEKLLLSDAYVKVSRRAMRFNIAWGISFLAFGILILAMVEDGLNFYSSYKANGVQMEFCNRTNITFWENFYIREHPHIFKAIPVNLPMVLVVEWINRCMRYTWSYLDIFIISFSFAAQYRYHQIYYRMASIEGVHYPPTFWKDIRADYTAVSRLVAFLDDKFGHLILLACANDMFVIATQLFNGFQRRPALATVIYFWYSLALSIFRTVCMLYVGSEVHVASMSPLSILRNVPSKSWGIDLQRLTDDVASGDNSLSGKKFFYLTRQIILAMAGTLVTYELVLMDQVKQANDRTKDCSFA